MNIIMKADPVDLDLDALPSRIGDGFAQKDCAQAQNDVQFEFAPLYTEDRELIVLKVIPLEAVDCNAGTFRLYRGIDIEVDYSPYSPILIKKIGAVKEAFPNELIDINVT